MSITFDGDVVVITGAARGLGRSHALLLARLGARVVVNDIGGTTAGSGRDEGAAATVVHEIEASSGEALADTHDASTVEGAQALIARTIDRYGRVDAVIANAGILRDQAFHNISDEDFFAVVGVHLGGTMRVFHAAYPHMRERGYGRLVATTSAAGLFGNFGQTAYSAAKAGIVGLTRSLALEGAKRNIKANVIAPGATTRMTEPLLDPRLAEKLKPAYVSPLAAYLCHPSVEVTGQVISVGAGRFARVGTGVGTGVFTDAPDADFVAAHLDEILAEPDLHFLGQASEEFPIFESAGSR
ncbi:SDR family NAD(P)-dependent oxidoreductase [Streptomyces plumbiresistens]|uniref:SDR family oxidoreductase n=1 Tax=Streptomyces plumbiresistens TaxID=511811 RepID=A0ABP7TFA6_9ACTN